MFISAVNTREPNMLSGSFCSGCGGFCFPRHGQTTLPVERTVLTYRVFPTEQDKSVSLPAKGKSTARWTDGGADMTSGRKRRLLGNRGDTGCVRHIDIWAISPDAKAGRLPRGPSRERNGLIGF